MPLQRTIRNTSTTAKVKLTAHPYIVVGTFEGLCPSNTFAGLPDTPSLEGACEHGLLGGNLGQMASFQSTSKAPFELKWTESPLSALVLRSGLWLRCLARLPHPLLSVPGPRLPPQFWTHRPWRKRTRDRRASRPVLQRATVLGGLHVCQCSRLVKECKKRRKPSGQFPTDAIKVIADASHNFLL